MKNRFLTPGFEIIFSIGIVAILCLPQIMLAQVRKDVRITIKNNDTIFNGKNLKDMPAAERQLAVAEIGRLNHDAPNVPNQPRTLSFNRPPRPDDGDSSRVRVFTFRRDSARGGARIDFDHRKMDGPFRMEAGPGNDKDFSFMFDERRGRERMDNRHRNTQNFDYNSTDKDGIGTHISYRVAEAHPKDIKRIAATDEATLEIKDLTLTPLFSVGKTSMIFTLPAKAAAEVQLTDSEGKTLWKDKTSTETFSKTFSWPMNGIYYLVVKQSGKIAMKRIVKE